MAEPGVTKQAEGGDWAARAVGAVDSLVGLIRDHSLRPALTVLRFLLLGLICAGIALLAAVFGVVGIVRLLTVDAFGGRVWASDLVAGGVLSLAGAFLLRMSSRVGEDDAHA